jgi:hypothetical protein
LGDRLEALEVPDRDLGRVAIFAGGDRGQATGSRGSNRRDLEFEAAALREAELRSGHGKPQSVRLGFQGIDDADGRRALVAQDLRHWKVVGRAALGLEVLDIPHRRRRGKAAPQRVLVDAAIRHDERPFQELDLDLRVAHGALDKLPVGAGGQGIGVPRFGWRRLSLRDGRCGAVSLPPRDERPPEENAAITSTITTALVRLGLTRIDVEPRMRGEVSDANNQEKGHRGAGHRQEERPSALCGPDRRGGEARARAGAEQHPQAVQLPTQCPREMRARKVPRE